MYYVRVLKPKQAAVKMKAGGKTVTSSVGIVSPDNSAKARAGHSSVDNEVHGAAITFIENPLSAGGNKA